jgi:hypothetical protein
MFKLKNSSLIGERNYFAIFLEFRIYDQYYLETIVLLMHSWAKPISAGGAVRPRIKGGYPSWPGLLVKIAGDILARCLP